MNTELILTQAQAEAVHSAICALNNVGSVFGDVRITADRAQHDVRVQWDEDGITVGRGIRVAIERYADQAAFAVAYGLHNSATPAQALHQIARLGREGSRDGQTIRDAMTEIAAKAAA